MLQESGVAFRHRAKQRLQMIAVCYSIVYKRCSSRISFQCLQHLLRACARMSSLIISMCQAVLASPAGRPTLGVLAFSMISLLLTSLSCHLQLNYTHHLALSQSSILSLFFLCLSFSPLLTSLLIFTSLLYSVIVIFVVVILCSFFTHCWKKTPKL